MMPSDGLCIVCREPLVIHGHSWRCRHVGHPAGARMPAQGMGDLYRKRGVAWGKLGERDRHSNPSGFGYERREK